MLSQEGSYNYAFLFWDDETRVISICPTKRKDNRAYKITYSNRDGRNASIAARSFCEIIGYDYSQHHSFLAVWNDEESSFDIDLRCAQKKLIRSAAHRQ